jgi:hypothetical protein
VATPEGREKQGQDIKTFIKPAIKQAGLSAIDDQIDGLKVADISDDLIQKICQADVLIMDANCYETTSVFQLSPYLYYYMAFAHSRGNATILVTNTITHLPHNLIKYHTLTYSLADIWEFIEKFKAAVEGIRQQQNSRPDNPIQDYLRTAEIEAAKVSPKQGKRPITFRPVN